MRPLGLIATAGLIAACNAVLVPTVAPTLDNGEISAAQYGEAWPFVVAVATLRCFPSSDGRSAVTVSDKVGNEFGLNGAALDDGFRGLDATILKTVPGMDGIEPFIDRGERLCEQ